MRRDRAPWRPHRWRHHQLSIGDRLTCVKAGRLYELRMLDGRWIIIRSPDDLSADHGHRRAAVGWVWFGAGLSGVRASCRAGPGLAGGEGEISDLQHFAEIRRGDDAVPDRAELATGMADVNRPGLPGVKHSRMSPAMTKQRFTPPILPSFANAVFGFFERTAPVTPATQLLTRQLCRSSAVHPTVCVSGVSRPNVTLGDAVG